MTRDETIRLFEACEAKRSTVAATRDREEAHEAAKRAWNEWAQSKIGEFKSLQSQSPFHTLQERAFIEQLGSSGKPAKLEPREKWLKRHSPEMQRWIEGAKADFSGFSFTTSAHARASNVLTSTADHIDFRGYIFPGEADFSEAIFSDEGVFFEGARFRGEALFVNAHFRGVNGFDKAIFEGDARFRGAHFDEEASFAKAQFFRTVQFDETRFEKDVLFAEALFSIDDGITHFDETEFRQDAFFGKAHFFKEAKFTDARFHEWAEFIEVSFAEDAIFSQATFHGLADFKRAKFKKDARFGAIRGERGFDLKGAYFAVLPYFIQAHFEEGPRLDDFYIGKEGAGGFWRSIIDSKTRDERRSATARFRALKRLASENHDHERELRFFRGELRSLRAHIGPLNWRYWAGLLYEIFSNFGSSALRPLAWWGLTFLASAIFYLERHMALCNKGCPEGYPTNFAGRLWIAGEYCLNSLLREGGVMLAALGDYFPFFRGLIAAPSASAPLSCVEGGGSPLTAALGLAFSRGTFNIVNGHEGKLTQSYACLYGFNRGFGELTKQELISNVPDSVAVWGSFQTLFSLALIFLFLLALRHHFRIN